MKTFLKLLSVTTLLNLSGLAYSAEAEPEQLGIVFSGKNADRDQRWYEKTLKSVENQARDHPYFAKVFLDILNGVPKAQDEIFSLYAKKYLFLPFGVRMERALLAKGGVQLNYFVDDLETDANWGDDNRVNRMVPNAALLGFLNIRSQIAKAEKSLHSIQLEQKRIDVEYASVNLQKMRGRLASLKAKLARLKVRDRELSVEEKEYAKLEANVAGLAEGKLEVAARLKEAQNRAEGLKAAVDEVVDRLEKLTDGWEEDRDGLI